VAPCYIVAFMIRFSRDAESSERSARPSRWGNLAVYVLASALRSEDSASRLNLLCMFDYPLRSPGIAPASTSGCSASRSAASPWCMWDRTVPSVQPTTSAMRA
jgi:hypothetical protein